MLPRFRPTQHPDAGTLYRCPFPFPATTVSANALGVGPTAAAGAGLFFTSSLAGIGSPVTAGGAGLGGWEAAAGRGGGRALWGGTSWRGTSTGGLGLALAWAARTLSTRGETFGAG